MCCDSHQFTFVILVAIGKVVEQFPVLQAICFTLVGCTIFLMCFPMMRIFRCQVKNLKEGRASAQTASIEAAVAA